MRVLLAMSGGVDSSVAGVLLLEQGHEVMGATMKLWGGESDSGCCSVADVDDARRVAQQLGIVHHIFAFGDDFDAHVVEPYVDAHARGRTPNPCIECNRHLKFGRFLHRARQLGFDAVATGHHARVVSDGGRFRLRRAVDRAKDQSYVLHMLGQTELAQTLLPVGDLTKDEVRRRAADLGLRTAAKPDSQDVCFISSTGGREAFLRPRIPLHPARLVDADGVDVGSVDAVELVTVGQRRGLGTGLGSGGGDGGATRAGGGARGGERRFALAVDVAGRKVTVGRQQDLLVDTVALAGLTWTDAPVPAGAPVQVQASAHGAPAAATFTGGGVRFAAPQRRVAPGQSVVLYGGTDGDDVLGGGAAT